MNWSLWFQPRNGSIGICADCGTWFPAEFQPRNGSIGIAPIAGNRSRIQSFNPATVRLEYNIMEKMKDSTSRFQPRNGSIGIVLGHLPGPFKGFQPRNGSIGICKRS